MITVVIGTRPEAVKLAPVVRALRESEVETVVCSTQQQPHLLGQTLTDLGLSSEIELSDRPPGDDLSDLTAHLVRELGRVLRVRPPRVVVVQGDTTSALAGALVGFYAGAVVAHVEAGLRSPVLGNPFPEEANRRMIGRLATLHFAPTQVAVDHLRRERVDGRIVLTGNTVVDSLYAVRATPMRVDVAGLVSRGGARLVLVTCHRREAWGSRVRALAVATRVMASRGLWVVWPVHGNPALRDVAETAKQERVVVVDPLAYTAFVQVLDRADVVVTDSGGVAEEAAILGRRLVVIRDHTERPETLASPSSVLLPLDRVEMLPDVVDRLLDAPAPAPSAAFGDGQAARRIAAELSAI